MKGKLYLGVLIGLFLVSGVLAVSDTTVFQGQYFEGNEFQEGTYSFTFNVYDNETAGTICFSDTRSLTTGFWGQWRVELSGISTSCNDTTKDYFMEIIIDNSTQIPRRRLTHFNYLRKNVADSTTGDLTISSILNFLLGGYIQEFTNYFLINKNLNVTGNIYSDNKLVCLEDGTNCIAVVDTNCTADGSCSLITYDSELNYTIDTDTSAHTECATDEVLLGNGSCISSSGFGGGSSGTQYVSFISTVDGKINKNDRYLSLGTDGGVSASSTEMSWIIDRDLTITGILWDSKSNSRTKSSAITLFKGSSKNSLSATSLSKDIQGVVSGSDTTFNISFSQGDSAAIKYESGGRGGDIEDLSITLIGTYD